MTVLDLRARRRALGLRVADVAYAARVKNWEVVDPSLDAATRIDAALSIIETGGCLDIARAASMPTKRGRKPPVVSRETNSPPPSWPEHSGAERLSGQCFSDVELRSAAIPRSVPAGGRGAGRGRI